MSTARIKACTAPESMKPQPLLVFFFSFVDSSRSSNIVRPSCRKVSGKNLLSLPEFSAGCGSGCNYRPALASPIVPGHYQRRGNAKAGVRSYQNSNHQCKGKSAQHLAAHQEQHQHSQKRQAAGEDGARKGLIDGTLHDALE